MDQLARSGRTILSFTTDKRGVVVGLIVERALGIQTSTYPTDNRLHFLEVREFGKVEGPPKSLAFICESSGVSLNAPCARTERGSVT